MIILISDENMQVNLQIIQKRPQVMALFPHSVSIAVQ